jgi:deoxyribodipyrimidine photo-lyase
MYVVDTHNLVPVWVTSEKREVGAYTIRPKIHKKLADYSNELILIQDSWNPFIRIKIKWFFPFRYSITCKKL